MLYNIIKRRAWGRAQSHLGEAISLGGKQSHLEEGAVSPGGDASPRRHLLDKARCLGKQIQNAFHSHHCIVLPSWGIEPQLDNADAGTRRPQVRSRRPQVRTRPPR